MATSSRSVRLLKEMTPYKIVRTVESDENILLFFKEYKDPREIMTFLLPRSLHPAFKVVKRLNNGEAAGLKFKYYGCRCSNGGVPIIRLSGRGFTKYLW